MVAIAVGERAHYFVSIIHLRDRQFLGAILHQAQRELCFKLESFGSGIDSRSFDNAVHFRQRILIGRWRAADSL
jgi:hypothetical protein